MMILCSGFRLKDQSSHSDYAKEINLRAMLQEITVLQTKLDATDDEDEQQALEEDVTGKVLWLSWCGILSEVKQRLPEVVEYIQRDGDSMTPEGRDRFRQGLREIGDIIKKTPHVHLDDDLAHLRRIMLDAGAGVSKHALWLVAQAAEQNKWSSTPILKEDYPAIPPRFMEHADTNYRANSEH
ncbi:hypothetical protein F5J12DRAFT_162893 [Pisolithus orientalis]|uniref:uncharacterized protein n=1 Tax=Pisolithus orientalis TaxID=936130 RepID=UPI002224FDBD|nr:uncharacterized protein F5J12DRAFT_162893 [Pisolithus orientalis]KAI6003165.1 hypothetical protein F5J12DRAFT_162893 [Pisolithus orientalis]